MIFLLLLHISSNKQEKKVNRWNIAIMLIALFWGINPLRGQSVITASDVRAQRTGDSVRIEADVAFCDSAKVATDRILSLTLRMVGQNDSVQLPMVYILGRKPYYRYARGRDLTVAPADVVLRDKTMRRLPVYHYAHTVPYQPWMDRATVKVVTTSRVCCSDGQQDQTWVTEALRPNRVIRQKEAQVETVSGVISGKAYINFLLDSVNIKPEFMKNPEQLDKIRASLDSVRRDTTATLKLLTIKGYASPEGTYEHNEYLARERTESLKRYIIETFNVPAELIRTDYEPEDWDGLREFLQRPQAPKELRHWEKLVEIAESDLDPDEKEKLMRTRYPADFRVLLKYYMPYLRHSDYTIEYTWKKTTYTSGQVDTLYQLPETREPAVRMTLKKEKRFRPVVAVKTNLLFDMAMAFNVELEAPLGADSRWSIMVEDWFPWFLYRRDRLGDTNKYRLEGQKAYKNAYEIWTVGAELRYWITPRCRDLRPALTGSFVGAYIASGKYDWEWNSAGDQGEFLSFGATYGHSWVLSRHWNLELSASAGYVRGPRRHYNGMFDNSRLIWQYTSHLNYIGPTKLKLSLVWLLGPKKKNKHE